MLCRLEEDEKLRRERRAEMNIADKLRQET
jgi:hypothetical protein